MDKFDQNSEDYEGERNYRRHNTKSNNYPDQINNGEYSLITNNVTFYPSINQLYFFIEKG